jgi:hypothetical protein
LRFQLPRSGLAGALLIEGRYIIWGQDGIFSIPAPDPRWSSSLVRGPAANILGVIPAGLGFLALSPDKLFRLDPQLRPVSELPLTGAFDMAPAGQYAIIAARTGITQVDITAPQLSALHTITRSVTAIGRANVSGHTGAFYALDTDGTHSILEFTPGGQVETLNTYADEPWFAASRTLGSTLVRLSPLRGILFVHQVRKVLRFQT